MKFELRTSQKYKIFPKQIVRNEIIQMSGQELTSYLQNIAMENPLISIDSLDNASDLEYSYENDYCNKSNINPIDIENLNTGYQLELMSIKQIIRLQLLNVDSYNQRIVYLTEKLAELLDEDGYLKIPDKELCEILGCDKYEYEKSRELLTSLDPAGVGARNLKENLTLQLERLDSDMIETAKVIVNEYLVDLSKFRYNKISKELAISQEEVRKICELIKELNPRPVMSHSKPDRIPYLVPDIFFNTINEKCVPVLNPNIYKDIKINESYLKLSKTGDDSVKRFIDEKSSQINWARQCVADRKKLLLNISNFLLEYQKDFFNNVDIIHPILQKDLAVVLDVDESTISRAIKDKYIQYNGKIHPFSQFIQNGQDDFSTRSIKNIIRKIINEENKSKPLSDNKIIKLLSDKGIDISRRTVAKYRIELQIPNSTGRKNNDRIF